MNIEGKIIKILGLSKIGNFEKQEIVVETSEKYPQKILIEFSGKSLELLDKVRESDLVSVGVNIRGREWINPQGVVRYFNTISGWSINPLI